MKVQGGYIMSKDGFHTDFSNCDNSKYIFYQLVTTGSKIAKYFIYTLIWFSNSSIIFFSIGSSFWYLNDLNLWGNTLYLFIFSSKEEDVDYLDL
jgi:hypothetical protein